MSGTVGCASGGEEIVVGKRELVEQHGISLANCPAQGSELTEIVVASSST